jgi:hypothetical protein
MLKNFEDIHVVRRTKLCIRDLQRKQKEQDGKSRWNRQAHHLQF